LSRSNIRRTRKDAADLGAPTRPPARMIDVDDARDRIEAAFDDTQVALASTADCEARYEQGVDRAPVDLPRARIPDRSCTIDR
jgi:hypothetical protein